ncbi:MAG: hemolysin family protein [bacterium]|nr:hemolysin family protein [bacterium]
MLIILILLLFCAFFAASEMAFIGCNWVRLKNWADNKKPGAKLALKLLHHQENLLGTILVGTNLTIVGMSLLANKYWENKIPEFLISLICTVAIFLFAEILPKAIVSRAKDKFFILFTPMYIFFYWVLYPFIFIVYRTATGILKLLKSTSLPRNSVFTKEEFRVASKHLFSLKEQGIILRLVEFDSKPARDIMIPLNQICAIEISSSVEEAKKIAAETQYSRLPVYEETLDKIVGYIRARDLLITDDIKTIIKECKIVTETKLLNEMLNELNMDKPGLIMVTNANNKITGMITMEDIIEELFGEIEDEYDKI